MNEQKILVRADGLYKNGKKLQLEFGNVEQIAALRSYEKKMREYKDGINPSFSYEINATASFQCICNQIISVEREVDHEGDEEFFDSVKTICFDCNRRYVFVTQHHYEFINEKRRVMSSYVNVKLQQ